jgi:thiopeptide-type bacteriocin biosynthesis protein
MELYQDLHMYHLQKSHWLSTQLFYKGQLEEFLAKSVKPLVDSIVQTGIANRYFFVRFYEDGCSMIKLRFQSNEDTINDLLKPSVTEHFNAVYQHLPNSKKTTIAENFTFDTYEQETKRYGGIYGMAIAEQHFEASSNVVLNFINNKVKAWNYETALGAAIQIQLGFVKSLGLEINDAIDFFRYYYQLTIHFNLNNSLSHKTEMLKFFEEGYNFQEKQLLSFHSKMWESLEIGNEFDDQNYNNWLTQCRLTKNYYDDAYKNFDIDYKVDEVLVNSTGNITDFKLFMWPQFANLLHLTNNRLGIHNRDESFLAYVMFKSLDKIH